MQRAYKMSTYSIKYIFLKPLKIGIYTLHITENSSVNKTDIYVFNKLPLCYWHNFTNFQIYMDTYVLVIKKIQVMELVA